MTPKKARLCSECGAKLGTAERLCPNCGADPQVSGVSETKEKDAETSKRLEWRIGAARFQVDKRGVDYTVPTRNPLATHGKEIGGLMIAYGIIKDSPGISTVGMTTMSQPNRNEKGWIVRWKNVREAKFNPEECTITLKEKWFTGGLGGGLGARRIQCTPENYDTVAAACKAYSGPKLQQSTRRTKVRESQPE